MNTPVRDNPAVPFTLSQIATGQWIRKLAAESPRGWKAFYHTKQWRICREAILERDHHQCQRCRRKVPAKYTQANTVHHIVHLRDCPELALTETNLESLCAACHEEEHPERQWKERENQFVNPERW